MKIRGIFKDQIHDHLGHAQQNAIAHPVQHPAKESQVKTPAIRPDEAPELAQKVNHVRPF